jgi:hypothetical protein
MKEKKEATLHKPADHETWRLHIMKAFADLLEPPTGVHTALKRGVRIGTNPTVKPRHRQPYGMPDSEGLKFEPQIARLLANDWVTDSHS